MSFRLNNTNKAESFFICHDLQILLLKIRERETRLLGYAQK